jgi:carotenoid phi-ring synthase / carotenoid chi-ring synthase
MHAMTPPSPEPTPGETHAVVVVGGGIAGLTAAVSLAERGASVLLLEKDRASLGGRVGSSSSVSFSYQGQKWRFENAHAVHGLWPQYQNLFHFIERHGLAACLADASDPSFVFDRVGAVRGSTVYPGEKHVLFLQPLHHVLQLRNRQLYRLIGKDEIPRLLNLGWHLLQAVHFDPNSEAHRQKYDVRAVTDFMTGIPSFHRDLLRSLTRSVFFSEPEAVSLWAFLVALRMRAFPHRRTRRLSLCTGNFVERVFDPLLPVIESAGGRVVQGIRVDRVRRSADGSWSLDWVRDDGEGPSPWGFSRKKGTLRARAVILATDVVNAGRLAARSPDLGRVYGDFVSFQGRPASSIRIWYARCPNDTETESGVFSGQTLADTYCWLHRFDDAFVRWRRATGGGAVECQVCAPDWKHAIDDQETIRRVKQDIERAFPEVANSAVNTTITRHPATHTNFPVGSAVTFPKVRTPHPSLALAGDWIDGGFPALYMERACQTGVVAANAILDLLDLEPWPVLEPAPSPIRLQSLEKWTQVLDRLPLDLHPPARGKRIREQLS